MPRFATRMRPISAQHPITEFYKEEFIKHRRCLEQQRAYYSEGAITDVETAITKVISQHESPSSQANAPQLVSALLKQSDDVAGRSPFSDPKHTHWLVPSKLCARISSPSF